MTGKDILEGLTNISSWHGTYTKARTGIGVVLELGIKIKKITSYHICKLFFFFFFFILF